MVTDLPSESPNPAPGKSVACTVQVGVFSATLPPEALEITRKFMNKPVRSHRGTCTNTIPISMLHCAPA